MSDLDRATVKRLFHFFISFDNDLKILDAGKSILKINPNLIGKSLYSEFQFLRPKHREYSFEDMHRYENLIIIFQMIHKEVKIRGEIFFQNEENCYYFLGSPWINKSDQLKKYGLILNDFALHDPTGDIYQVLQFNEIAIRDLNNREQELVRSKMELEAALSSKSEFLSVMSHEIRTPLNAIIGISDILNEKNQDPELKDNIKTLQFASESLLNLLNDILDYSKIEAGKIELDKAVFSLKDFILNLERMFSLKCKERGIDFFLEFPKNIPEYVTGDSTRLGEVLINLIGNAIKFTKRGSVTLRLTSITQSESFVNIQFSVIDSGIGIPADKMDLIFERFSQAHTSTSREYGGTGLGLTITKKLIQLHESDIFVKSTVGVGSEFYFTIKFPVSTSPKEIHTIQEDLDGYKSRVLLVDDNLTNIQIASHYLSKRKLTVDVAHNGKEAIEKANNFSYNIIFMDLEMPIIDGYKATIEIRKINSHYADIPIIALSAYPVYEIKEKALSTGFTDCLNKPFRASDLNQILNKYIVVMN